MSAENEIVMVGGISHSTDVVFSRKKVILKNGIRDACSTADIFIHFHPFSSILSTFIHISGTNRRDWMEGNLRTLACFGRAPLCGANKFVSSHMLRCHEMLTMVIYAFLLLLYLICLRFSMQPSKSGLMTLTYGLQCMTPSSCLSQRRFSKTATLALHGALHHRIDSTF